MTINTGWFPTEPKTCRCGRAVECPALYMTCEACRAASRLCQCPRADVVVEGDNTFCAICGGDLPYRQSDPLLDVADARMCGRFNSSL